MENHLDKQVKILYEQALTIVSNISMLKAIRTHEHIAVDMPQDFKEAFFRLIDKVSLSLMEEKDHFYGYFLFQMAREIRFDLSSPSGVNFKGAQYVIYFNPLLFLTLNIKQMETTIKHEIHHILSLHLVRAKELKGRYSTIALNMAMDIVVNKYLDYLPPYATTLKQVNSKYGLQLEPYEPFEYYAEKLQIAFDLLEEDKEGEEDDSDPNAPIEKAYSPQRTHDLWGESDELDESAFKAFTEKMIIHAQKASIPAHLEGMIATLLNSKSELPWHLYLNRLMGTVESHKKKTITRRNRRQPERLDLRGQLRNHKPEIAVALDISASMSQEEFNQAIKEVLHIVKNYNHEITLIECDEQIRRAYKVKSVQDIKERMAETRGTRFTPVFDYANKRNINLLIYFTDGAGEESLQVIPRGYKVLWVISGRGESLSLKESYGVVKKLSKVEIKDIGLDMSDVRSDGYSMNNQAPVF